MGLASALSTALTGLTAAETTIDVVGNNLANSNTVGFKASGANFATQFLQTRSLGSGPTATSGGSNPRQVGLGTMVADITPNFSQGTVEISSNPTDLAIQGDGFFVVEGRSSGRAYTRNGIFKMNSESQLTTITGNRLLGYGVNNQYEIDTTTLQPISIPLGSARVAKATENVYLEGTLTPSGVIADAAQIIQSAILGDGSFTYPTSNPTTVVSGPPNITTIGTAAVDEGAAGNVGTGDYYYKLVFADGPPGASINLEGTPSAATAVISVANPATNAAYFTGLNTLSLGTYQRINFYRTDGTTDDDGAYTYVGYANAGDTEFYDREAAGTTALNEDVLDDQYQYYVVFGKSGSDPSRPGDGIEISPIDGRVHITDLPSAGANPDGWDSWIIYRNAPGTEAGGKLHFKTSEVPLSSTTPHFT